MFTHLFAQLGYAMSELRHCMYRKRLISQGLQETQIYIIQMVVGATFKYDEPKVENITQRCKPF